ncbi:MAG TPA: hypothetical protein VFN67_24960, partial [Polyangiales bacterium]|nr:hypothetical protein [Polyangiales bacterium]
MNPYAAELRRKAMCRLATLRSARARAARVILQERTNPQIEALGATLRHGVPAAGTSEPEHEGPNVSTQPTLFVDVAKSPPPAMPQAFGQRTLSGVGAFDRAPDDAFTPDYAP